MKTLVIGSGITGILAAYYLCQKGHSVSVIDQERYPAMKCSYANGGQLSVSNSETWTTWSNVQKGISWMFTRDAPLLVRPSFEWAKLSWLAQFLWHTIAKTYTRNTIETIKLGLESRNLYSEIIKNESIEFDYSNCGILHIYKDHDYFNHAQLAKEMYESTGCSWEILSDEQTKKLDTALLNINGIVGSAWTPCDSVGDIHKFCIQLANVLETKYNVKFLFNQAFNIYEHYSQFDRIIISAGVGSKKIADQFGDNLPVYPVKGYSITITVPESDLHYVPKLSLLDDKAKIVTSTLGNRFRVAGTAELTGENYDIRYDRIKPLLNWVHENFPDIDTSNYSSWSCLRPMTPDMMPILKQSPSHPKVFYHTGHGHLGWTLSPATAKQLAEII